jgi:hypothetical protein
MCKMCEKSVQEVRNTLWKYISFYTQLLLKKLLARVSTQVYTLFLQVISTRCWRFLSLLITDFYTLYTPPTSITIYKKGEVL